MAQAAKRAELGPRRVEEQLDPAACQQQHLGRQLEACAVRAAMVRRPLGPGGDAAAGGDHEDVAHGLLLVDEHADGERPAPPLAVVDRVLDLDQEPARPARAQEQVRTDLDGPGEAHGRIDDLDGAVE
ncbi:hypothetical protein [Sorangium cellulosum]|uniref:hypothetical protein n=1 Tax=Sorangium cellulosum TaxID=56 RepID=UPI001F355BB3|nr:hypothetical protein [Sorangium cellulosum]